MLDGRLGERGRAGPYRSTRTVLGLLRSDPTLARHPRVLLGRHGYVLVLSHMRSYSTVLCHVLGSHEEIAGYAEMHQAYVRPENLLRLRAHVARSLDGRLDGRFVLDKVLHDHYPVAPEVLERRDVHAIFLVREPAATLASILRMGEREPGRWYSDVGAVAAYYEQRVRTLASLGRSLRTPALFLPAEAVVDDAERALAAITAQLGLLRPLEPSYRRFRHTGEPGFGDMSDRLESGRIERRPEQRTERTLPPDLLERAQAAYEECRAAFGAAAPQR